MSILATGNWKAIRDYLNNKKIAHNNSNNANHDERAHYFYEIIQEQVTRTWPNFNHESLLADDMESSFCPWLDDWVNAEPDHVDCRILRACIGTKWAWHA
eukprot:scaffold19223_cov64-Cylindrotheca_fusiformis.AAC.1